MQDFLEHVSEYLCFKELFGSIYIFFKKKKTFGDYKLMFPEEKVQNKGSSLSPCVRGMES